MKLGEALNRRADLGRRLSELRGRVAASAVSQEGEEPPEDINDLLSEAEDVSVELEKLVVAINVTNANTTIDGGATITATLARRDALAHQSGVLKAAAEAASGGMFGLRYGRNELKSLRHVDPKELRGAIDALAQERRALDTTLQETNWTVDLIEQ